MSAPALVVRPEGRALVVRLGAPHRVLGWALTHGGYARADTVAWAEVRNAELGPDVDPASLLRRRLAALGVPDAVGLMTSADVRRFADVVRRRGDVAARCVATVGLGNALRAGDAPWEGAPVAGTINLLVVLDAPLADGALAEALALAAEARTMAMLESGVRSVVSGAPATGTGTDCIVVAAPEAPSGARAVYAGKHTRIGHLVAASVAAAVRAGIAPRAVDGRGDETLARGDGAA